MGHPAVTWGPRDTALLWWCVAGSVAAHLLMLKVLPAWTTVNNAPPVPLTVELRDPPTPQIVPPEPLPIETRPAPQERPKPTPQKPVSPPREEKPLEQARIAPILTAPPETALAPAAAVVTEQRSAPPADLPRPQPPPSAAPAPLTPLTPPRSDAAYLNNPRPAYPLAARRRGDQGTVLVRVVVKADGMAASVALDRSSGHPALDEAALGAVKSWRFVPARQGGQAVESPYVVPVVFKLE